MYIGTTVLRYTFFSLLPHLTLLSGQGGERAICLVVRASYKYSEGLCVS